MDFERHLADTQREFDEFSIFRRQSLLDVFNEHMDTLWKAAPEKMEAKLEEARKALVPEREKFNKNKDITGAILVGLGAMSEKTFSN